MKKPALPKLLALTLMLFIAVFIKKEVKTCNKHCTRCYKNIQKWQPSSIQIYDTGLLPCWALY